MIEPRSRGVLVPRRSLSSGAHSRDPVAGMTVEGASRYFHVIRGVRSASPESIYQQNRSLDGFRACAQAGASRNDERKTQRRLPTKKKTAEPCSADSKPMIAG